MNNLNLDIKDLRVLRDMTDYFNFYYRIRNIRNIFHFNNKVTIDVIDGLDELSKLIGNKVPDWVIGTSFDDVILILDHDKWRKLNNETVDNLILHEFIHVVLNSKAQIKLPIWLNEGLAMYFADQHNSYINKVPKINENFDFYKIDYYNNEIYHISIYTVIKLIDKYGIECIVDETLKTKNFEQSEIFDNDNLLNLLLK
ncbi:hypothetical protein KQI36_02880 [Clostridium senegalense]|uniref:hypothetical protein n=1 Tax=Clostridium senegalense TaxID=1465809 RepID=UPI001C1266C4|nr:hypothetical protein [Clostridium senegalense]